MGPTGDSQLRAVPEVAAAGDRTSSDRTPADQARGRWLLAGVSAVIAVVWLGVLPRLDGLPVVRRRIQLLEQRRIDPAACFYTELEGISEIEEKMAAARAARPDAFWPWRAPQR